MYLVKMGTIFVKEQDIGLQNKFDHKKNNVFLYLKKKLIILTLRDLRFLHKKKLIFFDKLFLLTKKNDHINNIKYNK